MPIINATVRIGTPDDVHPLMDLLMEGHHENGFVDANPLKMLNDLWAALTLERGIVGVIGIPGQAPEALIVLRIGNVSYSDAEVIEEKILYVRKDCRKSRHARLLASFAKATSDKLGLPLLIGVLSNHRTKTKVVMYERMFGEPAGAFFLYNARTDDRLNAETP